MQRYQPIVCASDHIDSVVIRDAKKLEGNAVEILATKDNPKSQLQVHSKAHLEQITEISKQLQAQASHTGDSVDKQMLKNIMVLMDFPNQQHFNNHHHTWLD